MSKPKQQKIQYIQLSQQGKKKYAEVSKQATLILAFWMGLGFIGGYGLFKLLPRIPYLRQNFYIKKYKYTPFYVVFTTLSYNGYKWMSFQKRKGIRQLAKDPANLYSK